MYTIKPLANVEYPATAVQLAAWFSDDEACLDHLAWLRWGDGEFVCHLCGNDGQGWQRSDRVS